MGATRVAKGRPAQWLPVAAACAADAFLGFLAFRLSFAALTAIAGGHGVPADITWMFAVMVDGGAVTGTVGVVMAKRSGRSVAPYWWVVVGSAGVSLAFNIAHSDGTGLGVAIAVTPPLTQLVATELLVRLLPEPDALPTGEQMSAVDRAVGSALGAAEDARASLARIEEAAATGERLMEAARADAVEAARVAVEHAAGAAALEVGVVAERVERAADTAVGAADRAAQVVASAHASAGDLVDRAGLACKHVAQDATVVEQARLAASADVASAARCVAEAATHAERAVSAADAVVAVVAEAVAEAVRDATGVAERAADATVGAVDRVSAHLVDAARMRAEEAERSRVAGEALEGLVAAARAHAVAAESAAEAAAVPAVDEGPYRAGTPERVVYDLWAGGDRWPEEREIRAALQAAGLESSRSQAQKKRTKVGADFPGLPRKREQLELTGARG